MRQFYSTRQRRSRSAFTLIEIMVVVAILGILASVLVLKLKGRTDDAKVSVARSDIATVVTALEQFQLDMGRYPTTEEGLNALVTAPAAEETDTETGAAGGTWKGPYLNKVPVDPWGRAYVYECPGTVNVDGYDLLSYGKDGVEAGEDIDPYNADIKSWTDLGTDESGAGATTGA